MVREHIDALRAGMQRRGALDALSPAIDRAAALDKSRRDTIQAVEERKAARGKRVANAPADSHQPESTRADKSIP